VIAATQPVIHGQLERALAIICIALSSSPFDGPPINAVVAHRANMAARKGVLEKIDISKPC
jgi:hypothetical protein